MKPPAALFLVRLLLLTAGVAVAQESLPEAGERVAILEDRRISESSGLALGVADPSIFWTVNDSGSEPCLFAIDRQGKTRAKVRVRDAVNFDWEGLASYRDTSGKGWIFVGDIGDNLHLRPTVQIYQVEEPALPPAAEAAREAETAQAVIWHLTYPDGRRNAEALLVHPKTGRIYVISKSEDGHSAVYAAPAVLQKDKAMVMEKVIDLEFPPVVRIGKRPKDACQVTAADFAPDGRRIVIATYSYLHEWIIRDDETVAAALARAPEMIKPALLPQLEAVCYDADGRSLWLTSERLPAPLYRIRRKN